MASRTPRKDKTIPIKVTQNDPPSTQPADVNDGRSGTEIVNEGTGNQDGVDATIVGIAPNSAPLPAVVVADKTDKLGKRLGIFAIALFGLFFLISGYIQAAENQDLLREANKDRTSLAISVEALARQLETNQQFTEDLRAALAEQNRILEEAGLDSVMLPKTPQQVGDADGEEPRQGSDGRDGTDGTNGRNGMGRPPQNDPEPRPGPSPRPQPQPSPQPGDPPGPADPVTDIVCSRTGICI